MVEKTKNVSESKDWLYNEDDFMHDATFEDNRGLYTKRVNKPEYNNHQGKCTHRLCKELGVSHSHLDKVYNALNGRKIDGFHINDMLDRYGYEGSPNVNRQQLAQKYGKLARHLAVAFNTLKSIAKQQDPIKAFMKYQKEYEDALLKERRDAVVDGE
jgi:hypothetical protein